MTGAAMEVRQLIDTIHVVIPTKDEEVLLPACLRSVSSAVLELNRLAPHVTVITTVVVDGCTDRSALIARAAGAQVLSVSVGRVGAARSAGVQHATVGVGGQRTWIASTDADTVVPPHWLLVQFTLASLGCELIVGTVTPGEGDLTAVQASRWRASYQAVEGHPHIHGANLGFSLGAYRAVGGWPLLEAHEDVHLVQAIRTAGFRCCSTNTMRVVTSGRTTGRAPHGFAAVQRRLRAEPARPVPTRVGHNNQMSAGAKDH